MSLVYSDQFLEKDCLNAYAYINLLLPGALIVWHRFSLL